MLLRSLLLLGLLSLLPADCGAATVYVGTKEYPFEWGEPPADLDQGMDVIRGWLEAKPVPRLRDITPPLRKAIRRHLDLEPDFLYKFVVLGPPRVKNGKIPHFYAWIEWVHKSALPFDLDHRRYVRKAGVAKVAIEGAGENTLEIREWHWAERLDDVELHEPLPWDAAVLARKMLDFHKDRPRLRRERANGPGRNAPY